MLVVRESEKWPGLTYLASVNEQGEERSDMTAVFDELLKEQGEDWTPPPKTDTDRVFGFGKYDPKALESFERKILNKDELNELAAELAEKYDPTNMTGAEFDAFMEDLVKEGILSENELGVLGYHGSVALGSFAYGDIHSMGGSMSADTSSPYWDTYFQRYGYGGHSLQETKGNALDHVRLTLLWSKAPQGGEQFVKRIETQNSAFREMERILDAMRRKRQAMGLSVEDDSTSNACANSSLNSGLTWAEAMTRWKDASNSSDSLDEEVEDARNDMYAALDNVLEASMERRRLALRRG